MNNLTRSRPTNAERIVSSVLAGVTTTDAISSTSYANRLLDFRKRITAPHQNLRIPGVTSEPSNANVEIAWEIIQKIEQAEKTRLQELNEDQVGKYVIALSQAVGRRTRREYSLSEKTKRSLVKVALSHAGALTPARDYLKPVDMASSHRRRKSPARVGVPSSIFAMRKPKKRHLSV